mgnify:CR=1 FL=1
MRSGEIAAQRGLHAALAGPEALGDDAAEGFPEVVPGLEGRDDLVVELRRAGGTGIVAGATDRIEDGRAILRGAGRRGFSLGQFELGNRLDTQISGIVAGTTAIGCRFIFTISQRINDCDQDDRNDDHQPHGFTG